MLPELKISAFVSGPLAAILHFHQIQIKNMTFWCFYRWVCEDHPDQPWEHDGCGAAGELCTNPQCDKDADSIFLTVHC